MLPPFKYTTYQDVRRNLFLYSIVPLTIAGYGIYRVLLPTSVQAAVDALLAKVSVKGFWSGLTEVVVFALVAFLFVEIFKLHDRVYDKYVIRWRRNYDRDFILPRLLRRQWGALAAKFFEEADKNPGAVLNDLYYPFVGDHDTKIPKGLLVRFYERVTEYWLTQVNEIVLLLLLACVVLAALSGPAELPYRTRLLYAALTIALLFIANRWWARVALLGVRSATVAEIAAILENHSDELAQRLGRFCRDRVIPYPADE